MIRYTKTGIVSVCNKIVVAFNYWGTIMDEIFVRFTLLKQKHIHMYKYVQQVLLASNSN